MYQHALLLLVSHRISPKLTSMSPAAKGFSVLDIDYIYNAKIPAIICKFLDWSVNAIVTVVTDWLDSPFNFEVFRSIFKFIYISKAYFMFIYLDTLHIYYTANDIDYTTFFWPSCSNVFSVTPVDWEKCPILANVLHKNAISGGWQLLPMTHSLYCQTVAVPAALLTAFLQECVGGMGAEMLRGRKEGAEGWLPPPYREEA